MMRATYPAPALAVVHPTCVFIPPITHPLGQHWRQPDLSDVTMDDTHVLLTRRQFDALADYSTSTPSGVYAGKCWKGERFEVRDNRIHRTGLWFLRWFSDPPVQDDFAPYCVNNQREIILID
jgi:hypothetical protein